MENNEFKGRYDRNRMSVTEEEQKILATKRVCVIGCGGLGGGIIENLTRLGVGTIVAVDGDVFDNSNLNRQVLSNETNIGHSKAVEAKLQMAQINSEVNVISIQAMINEDNIDSIIMGCDVVVDALDNVSSRVILEVACHNAGIPIVHGAIGGFNGQLAVSMPGSQTLHTIYGVEWGTPASVVQADIDMNKGAEVQTGNPSFTPAVVAGMESGEVLKLLLGKDGVLENQMLVIDLQYHDYEILDL